jgi:glycosyltransferase involved in cell wall biosynthesis
MPMPLPRTVLIVTDAWHPQINGVVRSVERVIEQMEKRGIAVKLITPLEYRTIPMPGYDEIRLSLVHKHKVHEKIRAIRPDAIHIATEGPLGLIARKYCVERKLPFSTAYHTQFPEYVKARLPVPLDWSYAFLRWFHGPARYCLVGTPHLQTLLEARGFPNVAVWTKGVDTVLFNPAKRAELAFPQPVFLYVGRVAVEKNIEAFLKLDLPGTKLVVGDGPSRKELEAKYPAAIFTGARQGEDLAKLYAGADAFVFPSRTDTFGLVLLEALASGTPVAAYPVTGPIDVIGKAPVGVLKDDLAAAAIEALDLSREGCRAYAERFSWEASADQFLDHLPLITG